MHRPVLDVAELRSTATECSLKERASPFVAYDETRFSQVVGSSPELVLVAESSLSLFHEAGVYVPKARQDESDIWITSDILPVEQSAVEIEICSLTLPRQLHSGSLVASTSRHGVSCLDGVSYVPRKLQSVIPMGNGGTAFGKDILFCSQGQDKLLPAALKAKGSRHASSLVLLDPRQPDQAPRTLVNNFHGRPFTSLNDVVVHESTGTIFFTGPDYGFEQKFKNEPLLPNAVWRFDPRTGAVEMAADGIPKPNGLVFSPDEKTCYVTDTDFIHGDGSMSASRPGTIYAYDVVIPRQGMPQLHNKRVFAFVDCGAPDGIKVDTAGNVYTGCFDGVHIFGPEGSLIGKIALPRHEDGSQPGCANLVFAAPGQLVILSETRVWVAQIAATGQLKGVSA